jgi:hypothetical protein
MWSSIKKRDHSFIFSWSNLPCTTALTPHISALPGFAQVREVNWQIWIFSGSLAMVETFNKDFWTETDGINGLTLSMGFSFPSDYSLGTTDSYCVGNWVSDLITIDLHCSLTI